MGFYKISNVHSISRYPDCASAPAPTHTPDEDLLGVIMREFDEHEYIDAQKLKELLFPKQQFPVFLSYSSDDAQAAYYIKQRIDSALGSDSVFMDQLFWENAHDVLQRIQFRGGESTIPAETANWLASQFYMLLGKALKEAIQQSQDFILLIPSRCWERDGQLYTTSAWIHHECDIARELYYSQQDGECVKAARAIMENRREPLFLYPLYTDFMNDMKF